MTASFLFGVVRRHAAPYPNSSTDGSFSLTNGIYRHAYLQIVMPDGGNFSKTVIPRHAFRKIAIRDGAKRHQNIMVQGCMALFRHLIAIYYGMHGAKTK